MVEKIYFDWYGVNKDNPKSFGQITMVDADDEKLGVINLDLKYQDLFLLIFELFNKHCDNNVEMVYEVVIE